MTPARPVRLSWGSLGRLTGSQAPVPGAKAGRKGGFVWVTVVTGFPISRADLLFGVTPFALVSASARPAQLHPWSGGGDRWGAGVLL